MGDSGPLVGAAELAAELAAPGGAVPPVLLDVRWRLLGPPPAELYASGPARRPWTHGSAAARVKWFQTGFSEGTSRPATRSPRRPLSSAIVWTTALLVIVPTALFVGIVVVLHRYFAPEGGWLRSMEDAGEIFSTVGTGLAVLIAFLIVAAFGHYQSARDAVGKEAVAVQQQYVMASYFDEADRTRCKVRSSATRGPSSTTSGRPCSAAVRATGCRAGSTRWTTRCARRRWGTRSRWRRWPTGST